MSANTSSNNSISKIFSLTPAQTFPVSKLDEQENVPSDPTVENDFTYIRKNLYDVIGTGQDALASLVQIAEQSQHPRAYEVLAILMKTIAETNKDLLEMQKKKQDLVGSTTQKSSTVNNLILTTAELQRMIMDQKNEG